LRKAFDLGITHFDLANNYGPPPGSAEENFGRLLREDFAAYRDVFFFKQKTAYEISCSLVGSEMCVRGRFRQKRTIALGTGSGSDAGFRGDNFAIEKLSAPLIQ
ncbi:aldo/keto reductase, partial [Escherichia coli]